MPRMVLQGRLLLVAFMLGGALAGAVFAAGTVAPTLSPADRGAIARTITARWRALGQVPPARYAYTTTIPRTVLERLQSRYLAAIKAVAAPEFLATEGKLDLRYSIEGEHRNGMFTLEYDTKVLALTPKRRLANGDLVVWARQWDGNVILLYPRGKWLAGKPRMSRVDDTPTWQYQMREVGGRWTIVDEALVLQSEDMSPLYGPNTPHWVDTHPLISGNQGVILGTR